MASELKAKAKAKSSSSSSALKNPLVTSIPAEKWDMPKLSDGWKELVEKTDIPSYFRAHDRHFIKVFFDVIHRQKEEPYDVVWSSPKDKLDVFKAMFGTYAQLMRNDPSLKKGLNLSVQKTSRYRDQSAIFHDFSYDKKAGTFTYDKVDLRDPKTGEWHTEDRDPAITWCRPIDMLRGLHLSVFPEYVYGQYLLKTYLPDVHQRPNETDEKKEELASRVSDLYVEIHLICGLLKMKSVAFGGALPPIGDIELGVTTCMKSDQYCGGDICQECYYCENHGPGLAHCKGCSDPWESEPEESAPATPTVDKEEEPVNENLCKECKKELGIDCTCQCAWTGKKGKGKCLHLAQCHFCGQCARHHDKKCMKESEDDDDDVDTKLGITKDDVCPKCKAHNELCECDDKCEKCGKAGANGICVSCSEKIRKAKLDLCHTCGAQTERRADCKCGYCDTCCYVYGAAAPCKSTKYGKCARFASCCICCSCGICCEQTAACLAE
jgi:hypothetical protein